MAGLGYEYYETRTWGWVGLYRGRNITWHYFSNPNDIPTFVNRLAKLQDKRLRRVQAFAYVSKTGERKRLLIPHEHELIRKLH